MPRRPPPPDLQPDPTRLGYRPEDPPRSPATLEMQGRAMWTAARAGDLGYFHDALGATPDDGVFKMLEEQRNPRGWTAVHLVCSRGHAPIVRLFLEHGVSFRLTTRNGGTSPLHVAAAAGHAPVVAMLLEHDPASVNAVNADGSTPAHMAANQGRTDVVRVLMAAGADLSARDRHGMTPVDHATQFGHAAVVEVLLQGGPAHPGALSSAYAVETGRADVAGVLMASEAFDAPQEGLLTAALAGQTEVLDQLLVHAAAPALPATVEAAVLAGRTDSVRALAAAGVPLAGLTDVHGTPLLVRAARLVPENADMVRLLLDAQQGDRSLAVDLPMAMRAARRAGHAQVQGVLLAAATDRAAAGRPLHYRDVGGDPSARPRTPSPDPGTGGAGGPSP
ncbi:ankyrin repeat domain-containing protein [Hydrogenophaga sp.]|uniref:ankyrin repeat domain-containing protein n=1 Tax=Hydrogenophaga sp. TaxID=1904254 RepID=UPI00260B34E5|nr:ankyrin repeat domain-containing protein [Hydrogenophaga sp.]MCW5652367.1 ankyrin repeat domain-containing protein [Hydrogenophaga sp.]